MYIKLQREKNNVENQCIIEQTLIKFKQTLTKEKNSLECS